MKAFFLCMLIVSVLAVVYDFWAAVLAIWLTTNTKVGMIYSIPADRSLSISVRTSV